jgi:hypothetical protein
LTVGNKIQVSEVVFEWMFLMKLQIFFNNDTL